MPTKIEDLLKAKRQEILAIAVRHGAHNLRVFGSWPEERPGRRAIWIFW